MTRSDDLRKLVAQFFETDAASVGPDFPMAGPRMEGSVARYALDAAIRRRMGVKLPAVYVARTYADLEAGLGGQEVPQPGGPSTRTDPLPAPAVPTGAQDYKASLACGIDIELVANLPVAADYWTHEFYSLRFTNAEIAYCTLQDTPLVHFAGRWCAKEALKKCDPRFLDVDMSEIEVVKNGGGDVALAHRTSGASRQLPHALSITHTPLLAAAIVVLTRPLRESE
jgi:phosphopantetheine--protein transferase-like protein